MLSRVATQRYYLAVCHWLHDSPIEYLKKSEEQAWILVKELQQELQHINSKLLKQRILPGMGKDYDEISTSVDDDDKYIIKNLVETHSESHDLFSSDIALQLKIEQLEVNIIQIYMIDI